MDINDLRDQLAHYAQELDRRRESGILANVVTAFYEARRQLQRLTPQWHAMPTVEEVRARDRQTWICKSVRSVRVVTLTIGLWDGEHVIGMVGETTVPVDPDASYWPCDADGIRDPSWVTT